MCHVQKSIFWSCRYIFTITTYVTYQNLVLIDPRLATTNKCSCYVVISGIPYNEIIGGPSSSVNISSSLWQQINFSPIENWLKDLKTSCVFIKVTIEISFVIYLDDYRYSLCYLFFCMMYKHDYVYPIKLNNTILL